jgi:hypothetical protein
MLVVPILHQPKADPLACDQCGRQRPASPMPWERVGYYNLVPAECAVWCARCAAPHLSRRRRQPSRN